MTALGRTSEAGCAPGPVPSFFVDELLVAFLIKRPYGV